MRSRGAAEPPDESHRRCPAHDRDDRGSTASEYIGLLVLAALIVGVVVFSLRQTDLDGRLQQALCEILQLSEKCKSGNPGDKPGGDQPKKPNFLPVYCDARIDQHEGKVGIHWDWWFIHLHTGGSVSLMREKLANGEVWVTVGAGVNGGAGTGVGDTVELNGDLSLNVGNTYQFQNDAEADKWIEAVKNGEAVGDGQRKSGGYNPYAGGYQFDDDKPTVPKPHRVIAAKDVGAKVQGKAELDVPLGKTFNIGGKIEGQLGANMIYEDWDLQDPKSGRKPNGEYQNYKNYSYTWRIHGSYNVEASAGAKNKDGIGGEVGVGERRKWSAAVRYMYNPDGTLANIRWITTYERGVHGKANGKTEQPGQQLGQDGKTNRTGAEGELSNEVTRMTQVNFDTPEKRAIGEKYIKENGGVPPQVILDSITGDTNAVKENPHDSDDPNNPKTLDQLMFNEGKSWEWQSNNTNIVTNLWDSPLVNVAISDLTKSTNRATYLAGPQGDKREEVPFPQCKDGQAPASHQWDLDGY